MDSNHRRLSPADLQSAPFSHSGIYPITIRAMRGRRMYEEETGPLTRENIPRRRKTCHLVRKFPASGSLGGKDVRQSGGDKSMANGSIVPRFYHSPYLP